MLKILCILLTYLIRFFNCYNGVNFLFLSLDEIIRCLFLQSLSVSLSPFSSVSLSLPFLPISLYPSLSPCLYLSLCLSFPFSLCLSLPRFFCSFFLPFSLVLSVNISIFSHIWYFSLNFSASFSLSFWLSCGCELVLSNQTIIYAFYC